MHLLRKFLRKNALITFSLINHCFLFFRISSGHITLNSYLRCLEFADGAPRTYTSPRRSRRSARAGTSSALFAVRDEKTAIIIITISNNNRRLRLIILMSEESIKSWKCWVKFKGIKDLSVGTLIWGGNALISILMT